MLLKRSRNNNLKNMNEFIKLIEQLNYYLKYIRKNLNLIDDSNKLVILSLIEKTKEIINNK